MKFTAQKKKIQEKNYCCLVDMLSQVKDCRSDQGKRHPLPSILFLLIVATTSGCKNIAECLHWAKHNLDFLAQFVDFPFGLPDPTTISRVLAKTDISSLIRVVNSWWQQVFGFDLDNAASLDGKTIKAIWDKNVISHMLSLFTHNTKHTLGQVGVKRKENEITAAPRLLAQADIFGVTVTADALLTQHHVVEEILKCGGEYFLMVKGNQAELRDILAAGFNDSLLKKKTYSQTEFRKTRQITTTVEVSQDFDLKALNWEGIKTVGRIKRKGTRIHKGNISKINETVHFISSRDNLTAKQAFKLARGHWSIENNLHWQKDYTFLEDRQTLGSGQAPQIMTFLKSLTIGLFKQLGLNQVSQTIREFLFNPKTHKEFLYASCVV